MFFDWEPSGGQSLLEVDRGSPGSGPKSGGSVARKSAPTSAPRARIWTTSRAMGAYLWEEAGLGRPGPPHTGSLTQICAAKSYMLARIRPNLGPKPANFDQACPGHDQERDKHWPEFDRDLPDCGQPTRLLPPATKFGPIRPFLTHFRTTSAEFGQLRPSLANFDQTKTHLGSRSMQLIHDVAQ